jgi:lipopolysaccharide export system protein LptC
MIRPTTWLPLGVLALLVGLTAWLDQLVQPVGARADGKGRHDPDLVVENFQARKLGPDGRVLYTLAARKMVHYPDDNSSLLHQLAFDAYEPRQPRVAITADRGRLESGGDRVWVEGSVLVRREAAEKIEPLELATDRVLILPDEGRARTTSEVRLESPSGHALAAGFELDNRARTLRLQKVRATYKPPR